MELTPGRTDVKVKQPSRAASRVRMTAVAWQAGPGLALNDWLQTGRKLGLLGRNAAWWIGDWLSYGNHAYGERYTRAARLTGYDVQTLMNMVYVASHFTPTRRRENLSWSHHAEVAALEPPEADRWLERAEAERLSVRCLRQEIRGHLRGARATEEQQQTLPTPTPTPAPAASSTTTAAAEAVVCPTCGHPYAEEPVPPQRSESRAPQR